MREYGLRFPHQRRIMHSLCKLVALWALHQFNHQLLKRHSQWWQRLYSDELHGRLQRYDDDMEHKLLRLCILCLAWRNANGDEYGS